MLQHVRPQCCTVVPAPSLYEFFLTVWYINVCIYVAPGIVAQMPSPIHALLRL